MKQEVRAKCLPSLVGLEAVQGLLRQMSREKSIWLAHKADATVNCQ